MRDPGGTAAGARGPDGPPRRGVEGFRRRPQPAACRSGAVVAAGFLDDHLTIGGHRDGALSSSS